MAAPKGYREADAGVDHALGYTSGGSLDFDSMFEPFIANRGVVGGGPTLNDYTPLGIDDSAIDYSDKDAEQFGK